MARKHKTILFHFLFWIGYMLISTLIEFASNPKNYFFSIGDFFFTQFPNICTFYLAIWLFSKNLNPVRIYYLIFGAIVIYLFSFMNWYVTAYLIRPLIKANGGPTPVFNILAFAVPVLWLYIKYLFFAFGYHYAHETIHYQKQLVRIQEEQYQAQYAFLRAQINPHFLNNTLNFFYAKSLSLSNELADGIMTLSEIMRYSLQTDLDDRTTPLRTELEHIENVIKINQLRFNNKLQIKLEIEGEIKSLRIIPLILITIVENILKHGNCTNKEYPATVLIAKSNDRLMVSTFNLKKKGPKEPSSGIGMANIQKRLVHHYGKDFTLFIEEDERSYRIDLNLPALAINKSEEANIFRQYPLIVDSHRII